MTRRVVFISVFLLMALNGWPQKQPVRVSADNQALNEILIGLRDRYGLQLSFNDSELSKYRVTVSKTFPSGEEALGFLLRDLPFRLEKSGTVLIIVPEQDKPDEKTEIKHTRISGQIVEAGSYEPLPFSHVLINNHPVVSDVSGNFNFSASRDASFHLKISHLGYYIYDTVLYAGINQKFRLMPSTENIPEVEVRDNLVERALQVGDEPGRMKLNHNIARYLPGQGDNSVFNLLRLTPGIQAAGEQSTDLLIWGSYEGQSLITLDGFTLFGLKNFNDNISVVNPFWVKNIEILKGGYDARYGNRVGGLVNITGKTGNRIKPAFSFNINQTTLNGMAEVPLFNKSTLMAAYRQTYYNLYDLDDFNIFAPTRSPIPDREKSFRTGITPEITVSPDRFRFRDFNIKYAFRFDESEQFTISYYQGGDNFRLVADASLYRPSVPGGAVQTNTNLKVNVLNHEINRQNGFSSTYNKVWGNGNSSAVILSQSSFSREITDYIRSQDQGTGALYNLDTALVANKVHEWSMRIENTANLKDGHQLQFGGGIYLNGATIEKRQIYKGNFSVDAVSDYRNNRGFIFLQDNLPVNGRFMLKSGLRLSMVSQTGKFYAEPRLNASYQVSPHAKISASWGLYNQFMYKTASVDRDNNFSTLWVTGNADLPVLHASHFVSGFNFYRKGFTVNIDAYYKTTANLTRQLFSIPSAGTGKFPGFYTMRGDARTYGLDAYVKKDFGRHSIWASYTISKATERLARKGMALPDWQPAPHDQRHELKMAGLLNIRNFYLSADYVYGSGMEILKKVFEGENGNLRYNRIDAAAVYKIPLRNVSAETGLSILNMLDTQNLKASNLKNIFVAEGLGSFKIYTDAVPFTPTLFLKIVF